MTESTSLTLCAEQLNQSGDYQVLQKLTPKTVFNHPSPESCHRICVIDTETTGLDTEVCEIIELGYQIIEFDSSGHLYKVLCAKNFLNEPNGEISAEVTRVTGLSFDDVQGHRIPWDEVKTDIQSVQLCVAHNAGFDRPVLERYSEVFVTKIWGCSVTQIDWATLTEAGSKNQEFLCWKVGQFFYHAHRALDDVQALCQLLSQPISTDQKPALSFLLQAVRQGKSLVKATGAPFDEKDALRNRGYRWNAEERVWQKLLDDAQQKEELAWLTEHNIPNPTIVKLKATDSFSVRAK